MKLAEVSLVHAVRCPDGGVRDFFRSSDGYTLDLRDTSDLIFVAKLGEDWAVVVPMTNIKGGVAMRESPPTPTAQSPAETQPLGKPGKRGRQ